MRKRCAVIVSVVSVLAISSPDRARAAPAEGLSLERADDSWHFGGSFNGEVVNTSVVRVPAAGFGGVKLPSNGTSMTLDFVDFRINYGRSDGVYFPLGGIVYSYLFHIRQDEAFPDSSSYNVKGGGSIARLFVPGVGYRWTGGSASFGAELSPSVAFFAYEGTTVSAPTGRFGGHYTSSDRMATARLMTLDTTFLACTNFESGKKRPPWLCLYAAPIVYEWSSAGSADVLQGVRFGIKAALF
jgi:hypothetical protein